MIVSQKCLIEGCSYLLALDSKNGKRYLTKGYCKIHYNRLWQYGDVDYNYHHQRPHIDMGTYIKIPTQRDGVFILFDKDFKHVDDRLWSVDSMGYGASRKVRAHILVMGKQKKGFDIDHKNGDKLDNRRSNLRVCTHAQNMLNQGVNGNSKVGYKGVWLDKQSKSKRYVAMFMINGKRTSLGRYYKPEEAARAVDEAAKIHHGEYAYLNFTG